jgi:hypothetical protein
VKKPPAQKPVEPVVFALKKPEVKEPVLQSTRWADYFSMLQICNVLVRFQISIFSLMLSRFVSRFLAKWGKTDTETRQIR